MDRSSDSPSDSLSKPIDLSNGPWPTEEDIYHTIAEALVGAYPTMSLEGTRFDGFAFMDLDFRDGRQFTVTLVPGEHEE